MIILKSITDTLEVLTGTGAHLDISVSFVDRTTTTFNPDTQEAKPTSATTTTIVGAPAAATQRQIKAISIRNIDSISQIITVKKNLNTTTYIITPTLTLLAGEMLYYSDVNGWTVYGVDGVIKPSETYEFFTFNSSNNELSLSGVDTGILLKGITTEPSTPVADTLRLYAKTIAGRSMLKVLAPSGMNYQLQPAIFANTVVWWTPTGATAGFWLGAVGAAAGTFSTANPSTTNKYTALRRGRWANVITTVNQNLRQGLTDAMFFRGSVAEQGGFFFMARGGTEVWTAGGRMFVGLSVSTTPCTADPSSLPNILGFGIDAGDTAITFMHNDASGTATKDPIAGQPSLASNQGYNFFIWCKPNDTVVYWRIENLNATGSPLIAEGSVNTDLPVNTTMMTAGFAASNAALTAATAIQIGVNKIYVETDY